MSIAEAPRDVPSSSVVPRASPSTSSRTGATGTEVAEGQEDSAAREEAALLAAARADAARERAVAKQACEQLARV